MKKAFDPIQQEIVEKYCNGDMMHVTSVPAAQHCGDGLFTFLINEAAEAKGDKQEFLRMLSSAQDQLDDLQRRMGGE